MLQIIELSHIGTTKNKENSNQELNDSSSEYTCLCVDSEDAVTTIYPLYIIANLDNSNACVSVIIEDSITHHIKMFPCHDNNLSIFRNIKNCVNIFSCEKLSAKSLPLEKSTIKIRDLYINPIVFTSTTVENTIVSPNKLQKYKNDDYNSETHKITTFYFQKNVDGNITNLNKFDVLFDEDSMYAAIVLSGSCIKTKLNEMSLKKLLNVISDSRNETLLHALESCKREDRFFIFDSFLTSRIN